MKRIVLKNPTIRIDKETGIDLLPDEEADEDSYVTDTFDYRVSLMNILRAPLDKRAGQGFEEIARSMPIVNKLRKKVAGEALLLEDDDHSFVVEKVKAFHGDPERFLAMNIHVQFKDDIVQAQAISLERVEKALTTPEMPVPPPNGQPTKKKKAHQHA